MKRWQWVVLAVGVALSVYSLFRPPIIPGGGLGRGKREMAIILGLAESGVLLAATLLIVLLPFIFRSRTGDSSDGKGE